MKKIVLFIFVILNIQSALNSMANNQQRLAILPIDYEMEQMLLGNHMLSVSSHHTNNKLNPVKTAAGKHLLLPHVQNQQIVISVQPRSLPMQLIPNAPASTSPATQPIVALNTIQRRLATILQQITPSQQLQ